MDPADTEIIADHSPFLRIYKSGRIERLMGTDTLPAGVDPTTGVASKDVTIDPATGLSARLYLPKITDQTEKIPILVYYHGGGFFIESASSPTYHPFLNALLAKAKVVAVSVDYRLAPEHPLPAGYDDSWSALKWLFSSNVDEWLAEHGDFNNVFVAGDSAGGNIAHHMAMRAKESEEKAVRIKGMILIHPYFWGRTPIDSEIQDPKKREATDGLWTVANQPGVDVDDHRLNVTAEDAPSLAGLGCEKAIVMVAGQDKFVERGRAYWKKLKGSGWGGEGELVEVEEEGHVFHLLKPKCDRATELKDKMASFMKSVFIGTALV